MEHPVEPTINKDYLLTLINTENGTQLSTHKIEIVNLLAFELKILKSICTTKSNSLDDLIEFLDKSSDFRQMNGDYKYCEILASRSDPLNFNDLEKIEKIIVYHQLINGILQQSLKSLEDNALTKKIDAQEYNNRKSRYQNEFQEKVETYKLEIYQYYELISNAYSINKAYRKCYDNKKILTFSHRIRGWSNPAHNLNENFSIELRTNFGFGNSSYFYVKIKYKNVDICPISEWINYEIAEFSEIIRYTKSFTSKIEQKSYNGKVNYRTVIENSWWEDALIYAKDACNCSMTDENDFIEKYILQECEDMVKGLENIMHQTIFTFHRDKDHIYEVDKKGHQLIDFRGEKIVGALDFITKIIEFKEIISVKNFIKRIEELNELMHPILVVEEITVENKLKILNPRLEILIPKFNEAKEKYRYYSDEKQFIKNDIVIQKKIKAFEVDMDEVESLFKIKFPEYGFFEINYNNILEQFNELTQEINILNSISINIKTYISKINQYFKGQSAKITPFKV
jgi:hypothetical protein